ncbi:MAG TPA: low-specificity L-threonine aldolase [Candidatus Dormibacteraeota bacterium]
MSLPVIDLRSDTVTLPTAEMRRAMAEAELGDDVFGEDPTVRRLQERAAELTGKEAALFVPSGTMGNQLGVLVNARRGDALLAESESHTFRYEAGAAAVVGGVQILPLVTDRGIFTPDQVAAQLSPDDPHYPPTTAIAIENTHNHQGGVVWPPAALEAIYDLARSRGLRVHLDGARIFNAATACGASVKELAAGADTVTFCLSKGLACPAGSIFCGRADDMHEALRWRKMLGGGMRQAGVLAAAGLVALDTMIDRLADDHANARTLAEALAELPGVSCDLSRVETNMVFVRVTDAPRLAAECRSRGMLVLDLGPTTLRFVTHHGIEAADIQRSIAIVAEALEAVA